MKEICASGRVYIGVKRMGGLDAKPFIVDAKKRCLSREDTVKFLSIWEDHLRDPSWHPFKVITIGDDYKAQKIIDLMVRPLVGTPCPPIIPRKTCKFFGHLSIDRIKINQREMEEAVSMSHFSQLNTIEYDMAMEWFLMQSKSKKWWEMVHKEARLPLQIWVTEKTNGLLNEETGTNGVLNLEEFMRNKNKRSYRTIKKLDFTTILDPHVLILDHIIHIQSAASLFPLQHPSSSSFLFPLKQNHLPQPAASLSPLDHRIHHH
ncbi:unnamed protein product [Lactuca virosa]|uniref:Factor of DNA methylation 1-5/IDN2 domain-containing protein n=1 Tax=Lactuca virosa TaxID=75947 RepID=A0AAU9LVS0_9ASTR|nr:unnamed protein product [Lactuca virosa]